MISAEILLNISAILKASEVDINIVHVKVHLLRHRDPAHLNVSRILAREVQDATAFNIMAADRSAQCDRCSNVQSDCRFPAAGATGHRVAVAALQHIVDQIVRRFKSPNKICAGGLELHQPRAQQPKSRAVT
jgi:hypothetical protein